MGGLNGWMGRGWVEGWVDGGIDAIQVHDSGSSLRQG